MSQLRQALLEQNLLENIKEMISMSVTATEFKANLSKYIALAATEDIYITQYGKVVAKLTNPYQDNMKMAESLFGILPQKTTWEEAMEAREA